MKNGYTTITLSIEDCGVSSAMHQHHRQSQISMIRSFRFAFDGISWDVVYYELLKPNETITRDRYRLQLMCLSRALKEKRPLYEQRHDKVILQHDNAQ